MSVLVDTSVWVEHFRRRNVALVELIGLDEVLTHLMVLLELACGTPPEPRAQTLGDIELLLSVRQAGLREVREDVDLQAPPDLPAEQVAPLGD